jgi:hypothetical protein
MSQPLGNLAVNAKVKLGTIYGKPIQWAVKSKNHAGYPTGAITLVTDKIIKLMASDAREANNGDSNRKNYGNNRHIYSNVRQWLNKAGTNWYAAQHSADAAPAKADCAGYNGYDMIAGFLSGFTEQEIAALLVTTLAVNKASVDGGEQEIYNDKIFLLSGQEVGFTTDTAEGSRLDGFTAANTDRLAYPTADAVANSDYTSSSLNVSAAWYWWLRTPCAPNPYDARSVSASGALYNYNAYHGSGGLRPACNLVSSLLVSDLPDSDGCYTVLFNEPPSAPGFINIPDQIVVGMTPQISWGQSVDPEGSTVGYILERKFNSGDFTEIYDEAALSFVDNAITAGNTSVQYRVKAYDSARAESGYATSAIRSIIANTPPVISGVDGDLGTFEMDKPSSYVYTITDAQGGTITVTESVDDVILRTYTPVLGQQQAFEFTDTKWISVLNGPHTIKIIAQDPQSGQAIRTLTFTKNIDTVEFFAPTTPLAADFMPTAALIQVAGSMPSGSILTVKICNNGHDDEPAWEDCTAAVKLNQKYFFVNEEKTKENWGVKLHVKLERGTAVNPVYIASVGGNFK